MQRLMRDQHVNTNPILVTCQTTIRSRKMEDELHSSLKLSDRRTHISPNTSRACQTHRDKLHTCLKVVSLWSELLMMFCSVLENNVNPRGKAQSVKKNLFLTHNNWSFGLVCFCCCFGKITRQIQKHNDATDK